GARLALARARAVQGAGVRAAALPARRPGAVLADGADPALAHPAWRFEPDLAGPGCADRADPQRLRLRHGPDDGGDRRGGALRAAFAYAGAARMVAAPPARILHAVALGAPRLLEALWLSRRLRGDALPLRSSVRGTDPVRQGGQPVLQPDSL